MRAGRVLDANVQQCPVCGHAELVTNFERGEVVCPVCGTVVEERLVDLSTPWRSQDAAHAAPGPVGSELGEPRNKELGAALKLKYLRTRAVSQRMGSSDPVERAIIDARNLLNKVRSVKGLPAYLIEEAQKVYEKALRRGYSAGKNEGVAAALIYVCKVRGVPCNYKELSAVLELRQRKFGKAYRRLLAVLHRKSPSIDPLQYAKNILDRVLSPDLGLEPGSVMRIVDKLLREVRDVHSIRNGKSPRVLAAACIYIALKLLGGDSAKQENPATTQSRIAKAASVTDVALRETYKSIMEEIEIGVYV